MNAIEREKTKIMISSNSRFSYWVFFVGMLAMLGMMSMPGVNGQAGGSGTPPRPNRSPAPAPGQPRTAAPTALSSEAGTASPTPSATGIFATPAPIDGTLPPEDVKGGATWSLTISLSDENGMCSLWEIKTCRTGKYYQHGGVNGCEKLESGDSYLLTAGEQFTTDFGYIPAALGVSDIMWYISSKASGTIHSGEYSIIRISFGTDPADGSLTAVHTYASEDGAFYSIMDNYYYIDEETKGKVGKMDVVVYCGKPPSSPTPAPAPGTAAPTASQTAEGTASPTGSMV